MSPALYRAQADFCALICAIEIEVGPAIAARLVAAVRNGAAKRVDPSPGAKRLAHEIARSWDEATQLFNLAGDPVTRA